MVSLGRDASPNVNTGPIPNTVSSWRVVIVTGICIGLLGAAVTLSPPGRWIERTIAHDWIFSARGPRPSPKNVVVVSMDERHADLPVVTRGDRRWSRHLFATLIQRLTAAGASLLVLDVVLEGETEPAADRALEKALVQSDRVVLFLRLTRTAVGDVPVPPLPRFATAARRLAVFPLPKGPDRVEYYWPFFRALIPVDTADGMTGGAGTESGDTYALVELPSLPVTAMLLETLRSTRAGYVDRALPGTGHPGRHEDMPASFATNEETLPAMIELRRLAKGGVLHLNFYGPPRTIATLDHGQVLDAERLGTGPLGDAVDGKVVFLGYSDRSAIDQQDGFRTVYTGRDGVDISGVEIAATAYANLADGSMLRPASPVTILVLHVMLAWFTAWLALRAGVLRAIAFTAAVGLAWFALCVQAIEVSYRLLPLGVPVLVLLPVTLFSALSYRHLATRRQRDRYHHGIRLMVPARALRDIEASRVESAAPERLQGACMITDVVDYSHLSETLSPQGLASMSRDYFALLAARVESSGGELIDIEGDSMTAFWTGAEPETGNGRAAALAAVEIGHALEQFNARHADTPFRTRIGIHAGEVSAGNIGGGRNFRHRVVGDIVNTSSRLEGLNKRLGTSILATRAAVTDVGALLVRPVGRFVLKGKAEALDVVEVVGLQACATAGMRRSCDRLSDAMAALVAGDPENAEQRLVEILATDGNDGPARFYVDLLKDRGATDVSLDERGVVHLGGK